MGACRARTGMVPGWLALIAVVAVASGLSMGRPAPATAVTHLTMEAGYAGSFKMGAPLPVRIRFNAKRPFQGELAVSTIDGLGDLAQVVVPMEVSASTVKEAVVVVPSDQGDDQRQLRAQLREEGTVVAEDTTTVTAALDQELVGLLPGVLGGRPAPGVAPLAIDAGTARFSPLGPTEFAVAPASLAALDVIGASPGDLAALDSPAREAVLAWVAQGGHLLVDTPAGGDVEGLPGAWQPGERGRSAAGLGEVRSSEGAMAAGSWAGLIEPTRAGTPPEVLGAWGGSTLEGTLVRDAVLEIPRLPWLVGFALVYVVLAVPLALTILRRRGRRELGWVVLPVVALVFTGVSYQVGRAQRGDIKAVHATTLHTSSAGAAVATTVGVISPDGGSVSFGYPQRWAATGRSRPHAPGSVLTASLGRGGTTARQQLDLGQFGLQRVSGPVAIQGRLELSAVAEAGGAVAGTVRNTAPFALEETAVFHDRTGAVLGPLGPGEERAFHLAPDVGKTDWVGPAGRVWPDAFSWKAKPAVDSVVAAPLWKEFESLVPSSDPLAPGRVVAGGWTRDYQPPVEVPGSSMSGTTLVVGTEPVGTGAAGVVPATVATDVVRGPFSGFDEATAVVVRLVLPGTDAGATVDPASLELRAPAGFAVEVWREGAWRSLDPGQARPASPSEEHERPFGPLVGHSLASSTIDDGVAWVRLVSHDVGSPERDREAWLDPILKTMSSEVTIGRAR
ncbi:MAG TPA: hypothetical protein VK988_13310 [Acidimicrobiales bacterium]|nr:hypothetical protein [Acidimicrobiales bacterium]